LPIRPLERRDVDLAHLEQGLHDLPGFPDFASVIISPSLRGMTCHDTPKRSLSHPHGPGAPPSESRFQTSSSSACVSTVATSEMPSLNPKLGPPSIAVNCLPSSSNVP